MPALDMPLEKLKQYQGINPKPEDFDQYWNKSIAEMKAIDSEIELVPHKINAPYAECFNLYFTGIGNARIRAQYIRPKNSSKPHPAVIMFHGYSGNSGDWSSKLNYVGMGYSVAALDCRGQSGFSEDTGGVKGTTFKGHIVRGLNDDSPEKLLFRSVFLDCAQLAGIVMNMPEVDENRVGTTGGSQGGALCLVCGALEPRVKRIASVFPFLSDYKRVWDMDLAANAYEELKTFFRHYDPLHERENEIFTRLGYIDIQNLVGRIKGEVLMGLSLMDNICPPSTQFAAFNKIKSKKYPVIYPDFGHEALPYINDKIFDFMAEL